MDQDSNLCSNCRNPLSFMPRVNVDLHLDPSISSSLEMRQIISLCDEDLDDYDTEIIRFQNQIIHLQAQKQRLSNYKTQLRSFLSLFWQIPNEILCTIFESTCAENLLQEYPWPQDNLGFGERPITRFFLPAITYLPALVISAVCTRWRSLALASPGLWSQLRLERGDIEKALDSGFVSTLRLYLNRSVDAPLSIDVAIQGKRYLPQNRNSRALNLLLDHADRWRTFSYAGDYDLEELIGPDLSFPILENLTLQGDQITVRDWNFKLFEDAPKLLAVAVGGSITDLPRSWNRLTSLQLLSPLGKEEMDSLQRYSHLTNLRLSSPSYGFGTGITLLARLESFTLVELPYKRTSLSDMFSTMTLPSLTELVIDSITDKPRLFWEPDDFRSFISRSTCTLTTLSLRLVMISDQLLLAALRILPSLVNFCIDDCGGTYSLMLLSHTPLTKHFILSMSASSRTPVLPKLHTLSITAYHPSFDDAAFVEMVSSRWLPGPSAAAKGIDCLRSLVLRLPTRAVDEEIYRPLEDLDRMGMQVVVTGKRVTGTNAS